MPPFTRSTLTYSAAQTEVAGAAGTNTAEMLARAGNSLDAVAQKWNRRRWKFLQADQLIALVAPFTVSGCTVTAGGSITTTVASGFGSVLADDVISGSGIFAETYASAGIGTGSTAITASIAASSFASGLTLTFTRPLYALATDFKTIFDIRLQGSPTPLKYQPRREYDLGAYDQTSTSTPYGYDLYYVGGKGKIRLIPPPNGVDSVWIKYYRRMTMPSVAAASGLDLPEDYEDIFVAAAKAHFLADKGQAHREQWMYWDNYAKEGLAEMRRDERLIEDEDLTLLPPNPQRIMNPDSPYFLEPR